MKRQKSFVELFAELGEIIAELAFDNAEDIIGTGLIVVIILGIISIIFSIG